MIVQCALEKMKCWTSHEYEKTLKCISKRRGTFLQLFWLCGVFMHHGIVHLKSFFSEWKISQSGVRTKESFLAHLRHSDHDFAR